LSQIGLYCTAGPSLTDLVYDLLDSLDVRRTISAFAVEVATTSDTARRKNEAVHLIVAARRDSGYSAYICALR
jgi:hypothetical protein